MHIIVAGGGKAGRKLIHLFRNHRHYNVTVVDSNRHKCEEISELFPNVDIILGDVTHPSTIKEAMSNKTEAFVAVTGEDRLNLLAAAAATNLGVPQVILRIIDPEHRELAKVMNLDNVLDPADSLSAQAVARLAGVDIAELIHRIYPTTELMKVGIDETSELIGMPVEAVEDEYRRKVYPILVLREGLYRFPNEVDKLRENDQVLMWQQRR